MQNFKVNVKNLSPKQKLRESFSLTDEEILYIDYFHRNFKPSAKQSRIASLTMFLTFCFENYGRGPTLYSIKDLVERNRSGKVEKQKLNIQYLEAIIKNNKDKILEKNYNLEKICPVCGDVLIESVCGVCG